MYKLVMFCIRMDGVYGYATEKFYVSYLNGITFAHNSSSKALLPQQCTAHPWLRVRWIKSKSQQESAQVEYQAPTGSSGLLVYGLIPKSREKWKWNICWKNTRHSWPERALCSIGWRVEAQCKRLSLLSLNKKRVTTNIKCGLVAHMS